MLGEAKRLPENRRVTRQTSSRHSRNLEALAPPPRYSTWPQRPAQAAALWNEPGAGRRSSARQAFSLVQSRKS